MWLIIAKVLDNYGNVTHFRVFDSDRSQVRLMNIETATKYSSYIRNAGTDFSGELKLPETMAKIPLINRNGFLLTSNVYFVVTVFHNNIVRLVDATGAVTEATYNSVKQQYALLCNAWVEGGVLTGYFDSQTSLANGVPLLL